MRLSLKYLALLNLIQFVFICLVIGIYFYSTHENKISNFVQIKNQTKDVKIGVKTNSSNEATSSSRNFIWEQLNENVFFKRTSAFFIIERLLLRLYYVSRDNTDYEYNARVVIELDNGLIYRIHLKNGKKVQICPVALANTLWKSLNFEVNLLDYIKLKDYDELLNRIRKFHLYLSDSKKQTVETLHYIEVKMKYIRSRPNNVHKKQHAIVCSKCFWYTPSNYKDFFWWIEMHKQAGYKKVLFCNNSIPNTKEFNQIVEMNKDFVEISQLTYLPNFRHDNRNRSSKSHNYLNYFHEFSSNFGVDSDIYNMIMTNECFLNNTDKYSHVSVIDNDEIIMPRINSKLVKTSENFKFISNLVFQDQVKDLPKELVNLESSCSTDNENKLDNYFNSFTTQPASFQFGMGFYLRDKQIRQIIETFEEYFKEKSSNLNYSQSHKIVVLDKLSAQSDHNVYNFTFILANKEEINYAINLCKIYRQLVEHFEKENKNEIQKYSDNFHRFFYIGGLLSSFAIGKSSYSTDVSFEFTVHYPEHDQKYPKQAEFNSIGHEYGQLSHFRSLNEFHKAKLKEISIQELILDLNYLSCFYKPIVEKFSKIKLF
jgi:hypothetical protein